MAFVVDLKTFAFDQAQITQLIKNVLEENLPKDLQKASLKEKYAWIDKAAKSSEIQMAAASAEKAFKALLDKYAALDAEMYNRYKAEVSEAPKKIKARFQETADKKVVPNLRNELRKTQDSVKRTIQTVAKKVKVS